MSLPFLDTNIFLRQLLNDDPAQSPPCFALFEAIEQGKMIAWTSDLVIAELVFVLSNKRTYNVDREVIRDLLLSLINLPGIKIPRKQVHRRAFALYTAFPIDYIDAHHVALMESRKETDLYSYDRDFDRIASVTRHEP